MKNWAVVRRAHVGLLAWGAFGIATLWVAVGADAQSDARSSAGMRITVSGAGADTDLETGSSDVVRVIDDPYTGNYWLLERDLLHPGGPGRLVLVTRPAVADDPGEPGEAPLKPAALVKLTPVIRAGDRLVVEENTAVVEARLEAVALGPAVRGADFEVRLQIGGKVVRAVALGPGRAAFTDQIGAQP